jgi:hypothetical protein
LSLAAEPSGGVTLKISAIEGLPGTDVLIPIVRDSALQLHEGMGEFLEKTKVFTPEEMRKEARRVGPQVAPGAAA